MEPRQDKKIRYLKKNKSLLISAFCRKSILIKRFGSSGKANSKFLGAWKPIKRSVKDKRKSKKGKKAMDLKIVQKLQSCVVV